MDYLLLLITFLSTSYSLIYSTEQLYERFFYYPHFTAVETESQKDKLFKVTQLVGGRVEIPTQILLVLESLFLSTALPLSILH